MGLAKIANFINKKKEENPNAIFLAGGDMLQGSALSNHYKGKSTLKLLDMMGLDFFTIGNHEFDWGIDTVSNNFGGQTPYVSYPLVSANIFKKGTENLVDNAAPYHIIEKGGIKFGIIGYIGYGLENSISANQVKDYEFRQPGPIVEHWSNYLRVNEGVDFVIAVGHDVESNDYIRNLTGNSKVDLIF
ncbi:MAG: multifunctional 2',3'-cyclic-nucleotide 2'-phosphodiesterase/5'-nucleotidase/3'-nucleotidase, partial [Acholeplasmataceae bacterium]|nr:multifunctional 2',3'-cyclic-nucleotide 2'-phosphodiesterase/5'-nucleotidase/3'-nucleotidase [Acholeplasmataceae bacterium]